MMKTKRYKLNNSFKQVLILIVLIYTSTWNIVAHTYTKHMYGKQPLMLTQWDHKCNSVWTCSTCVQVQRRCALPPPYGKIRPWSALQWVSPPTRMPKLLLDFSLSPSFPYKTYPSTSARVPRTDTLDTGFGLRNGNDLPLSVCVNLINSRHFNFLTCIKRQ